MVLPLQRLDHFAIKLLVHQKVAESARRHDADAQIARKVVDQLPNRRAEIEATRGAWLIWRVISIQHDGHDGDRPVRHKSPVDKRIGVTFELPALQRFHRRDVETPVGQSGRNVGAEPGVAGVEALVLLLHALALVLEIPAGRGFGGCRRIADAVAIVDGDRRAALVAKNLTLIVATMTRTSSFAVAMVDCSRSMASMVC